VDPTSALQGAIFPQQVFTGQYVYDTRSVDSNALPSLGEYFHSVSSFGMEVDAPGFVFRNDPQSTSFLVRIGNGTIQQGQPVDLYEVRSDANLSPRVDLTTDSIEWKLTDNSASAHNDDLLPDDPPQIGAYNGNVLRITGHRLQTGAPYEIQAQTLSCVPCSDAQSPTSDAGDLGTRRIQVAVGPNPFQGSTLFRYQPVALGPVRIDIWDVAGRRVRRIVAPAVGMAGQGAAWDGMDDGGRTVAAGVYFYRMSTPDGAAQGAVVRLR
jgi:hypothetical protein